MLESKITITADRIKTSIITGRLHEIPNITRSSITLEGNTFNFYLQPGYDIETVYDELLIIYKRNSAKHYHWIIFRTRLTYVLFTLFYTSGIILMILVAELLGNTVYDNIGNRFFSLEDVDRGKLLLSVICYIILFFALLKSSSLFQNDATSVLKWWNKTFRSDRLMKVRVITIVNDIYKRQPDIDTINIWNPNTFSNKKVAIVQSLIKNAAISQFKLNLYIRVDELTRTRRFIDHTFADTPLTWTEHDEAQEFSGLSDKQYFSIDLMTTFEKEVLSLLLYCSTLNVGAGRAPEKKSKLYAAISVPLAECIYEKFRNKIFTAGTDTEAITLDSYISRFINDYNLFDKVFDYNIDNWRLKHPEVFEHLRDKIETEMGFINPYIQSDTLELVTKVHDPIGAILLLNANRKNSVYSLTRKASIEHFVYIIGKHEVYDAMKLYWADLIDTSHEQEHTFKYEVYRLLPHETVRAIAHIFINAGMFQEVPNAVKFLKSVDPDYAAYLHAEVDESMARHVEAITAYREIIDSLGKARTHHDVRFAVRVKNGFIWAVLSSRIMSPESLNLARQYLEEVHVAIKGLPLDSDSSYLLADYYNRAANLYESEGNYGMALETYERGLTIPGIGSTKYSSMLVNKGIAHRMQAHKVADSETMPEYRQALTYGKRGVRIKRQIGNYDQLPIAIHNYCETIIRYSVTLGHQECISYLLEGNTLCNEALAIQAELETKKKSDQLRVEQTVFAYLLHLNGQLKYATLVEAYDSLRSILKSPAYNIYDREQAISLLTDSMAPHGLTDNGTPHNLLNGMDVVVEKLRAKHIALVR